MSVRIRRLNSLPRLSETFSRLIEDLRRKYGEGYEFFKDWETDIRRDLSKCSISLKPYVDESMGMKYERETEGAIRDYGFEAVALYIPYHLTRDWGIYIFTERLNGLSHLIARRLAIPFDNAFDSCNRAIIEHESFHFQTEYSATIIETILTKPVYLPYFKRSRPYDPDEEAIANAWMLTSKSPYIRRIRLELERLSKNSPPGYRDYGKYVTGGRVNYDDVRMFWAQRFLGSRELIALPTRLEMPQNYTLIPIYYISLVKAPETTDMLYFIYANYSVDDIVKKLKKILPEDIINIKRGGRHPYHIVLKGGGSIPVPHHSKEGGYVNVKIVNEVADKVGIDRKWLRERVRNDP